MIPPKQFQSNLQQLVSLAAQAAGVLHGPAPQLAAMVTGPQRVAMNSIKHNVTGQNMFLQAGEFLPYMELGRDFFEECRPVGIREIQYVQKIIDTNWRLNRACAVENNILNISLLEVSQRTDQNEAPTQGMVAQATGWSADCSGGNVYDKMSRYETRLRRGLFQYEHELTAIQEKRIAKNGDKFDLDTCKPYQWYSEMVRVALTPVANSSTPPTNPESTTSEEPLLCQTPPVERASACNAGILAGDFLTQAAHIDWRSCVV